MSSYIQHELFLLFQSVFMGALLLLCYDGLLVLRKILPHPPAAVNLEDFLFWIAAAFFLFLRFYKTNHGILRNFLFLGVLLGAKIVKIIINRLLFWMKRCKILMSNSANPGGKCTQKGKKQLKRGRQFEKIREKEPEKENRV